MCDVGNAECGYKGKLLRNGSCFNGVDEEGKQIATIFTLKRQLDQFGGNHIISLYKTWGLRQLVRSQIVGASLSNSNKKNFSKK